MDRIRMKMAFMFAKIVTCFLLWHMFKYTGKLAVKFYVHLAYLLALHDSCSRLRGFATQRREHYWQDTVHMRWSSIPSLAVQFWLRGENDGNQLRLEGHELDNKLFCWQLLGHVCVYVYRYKRDQNTCFSGSWNTLGLCILVWIFLWE